MVRDPGREALIELIFRLALRGRTSGQIAASVNNAGWLTKPIARHSSPMPFDIERIYEVLNPRYAAPATWQGEVIARGRWPAGPARRRGRSERNGWRARGCSRGGVRRTAPERFRVEMKLAASARRTLAHCYTRCGARHRRVRESCLADLGLAYLGDVCAHFAEA